MQRQIMLVTIATIVACSQPLQPGDARSAAAVAAPQYEIVDLGTLGGPVTEATAINDGGQVVGWGSVTLDVRHAFLWENGVMKDLGTLGGDFSRADAINARGDVAGPSTDSARSPFATLWSGGTPQPLGPVSGAVYLSPSGQATWSAPTPGGSHLMLWRNGATVDLGTLGGDDAAPAAINSLGLVVGSSRIVAGSFDVHAFVWRDGAMRDLGTLGGCCSRARDVNDRGQVTGAMGVDAAGNAHAFVWDAEVSDLGTLPGDIGSAGIAVNEQGQVAGESYSDLSRVRVHAFLWSNGVMQPLWGADYAKHEFDRVTALNDQGQVVGYGGEPPVVHALLWEDGTGWDLGTLGGVNSEARAINARGDIVGQAETASGEAHAVLWRRVTPQVAARGR